MAKSLSSQSARARMQKHQKEAPRHAAPDERERIPPASAAERLGPIISPVHTNDLTLTRNNGLLVSPFLERFLDRSEDQYKRNLSIVSRHMLVRGQDTSFAYLGIPKLNNGSLKILAKLRDLRCQ